MTDYGHDLLFGTFITPGVAGRSTPSTWRSPPTGPGWTW